MTAAVQDYAQDYAEVIGDPIRQSKSPAITASGSNVWGWQRRTAPRTLPLPILPRSLLPAAMIRIGGAAM